MSEVQRTGTALRRRARSGFHFAWRLRAVVRQGAQTGNHPQWGSRQFLVESTAVAAAADGSDPIEEEGVGVVIGDRFSLEPVGFVPVLVMVMVMVVMVPARAVMVRMVVGVSTYGGDRIRVEMGTEVVSGGLAAGMQMAEGRGVDQQHARNQDQGETTPRHSILISTKSSITLHATRQRIQPEVALDVGKLS